MTEIVPFKIAIPEAAITELRERLEMTRWPVAATNDWSHGQPVRFVKALADQWLHSYDWRKHEAELNRYPQFSTEIDRQSIHFLHVKSPEPNAVPVILTHGWPSTVAEFLKVIGPLSDSRAHDYHTCWTETAQSGYLLNILCCVVIDGLHLWLLRLKKPKTIIVARY